MRWFTSDTHFGHKRILELSGRPFDSIEHHDAELARRWNDVVDDADDVWILGDLALGTLVDSLAHVGTLRGRKHLVPGNHDRMSSAYTGTPAQKERWTQFYLDVGIHVLPIEETHLDIGGHYVKLCHFPYWGDSQENDRHLELRPYDDGTPLLHGHIHELRRIHGHQFNVGVDVNGFTPVPQAEVERWLSNI